jgi:MFS family permease
LDTTRDRRSLIAAVGLSSFGDELAIVALALRVEQLTGSAGAVALLFVAFATPHVVFAPVSGMLTDRRETVQTLRWCSIAQAVVATALAFATGLAVVLVLAFLLGALASVSAPSIFSLVPLLGEEDVAKTNSSIEIAKYVGWITGPFAAGVVASRQGTGAALLIDAATFLVLALVTIGLRVRRLPIADHERAARGQARAGFAFVARDRLLLLVFAVVGVVVLFAAMDNVAEVFFAKDTLEQPEIGYGVLASSWLGGMVLGALVARRISLGRGPTWIFAGAVVGGLAVGLGAWSAVLVTAAALFIVGGAANGLQNVITRSLVHDRVPAELHGRVFAAYLGLVNTTQIIATMVGGVLVGAAGGQQALLIAGAGTAFAGLIGLLGLSLVRSDGETSVTGFA